LIKDDPQLGTKDEALLKRIRQRFSYGMNKWRRNREEGQLNMRYVAGDPWTDKDKEARKDRPTVCPDELNQYVNQVVNTARQNPRGIKVDPAGDDATDKLAEYRENRIRAIEYACNASQVYVNGLQAAVERNIGYWKVSRAYVSDESDEQEILVLPVQNPDAVLIDPDFKELDGSDIRWAFELDKIPLDDFEIDYPRAEKTSFQAEDFGGDSATDWYDGKSILVASYWEIEREATSKRAKRVVRQYITNGAEILKKGAEQPGPYIPIVPVFGKELWVDYTGTPERLLISLISLARDPQKALAYVMSSMIEDAGQIPKATFIGAKGQFECDSENWALINKVYFPTIQYDPVVDAATGQVLPPPTRVQLTPNFQSYAAGIDVCRRAIQAAMGVNALPTAAQRQNQKSGVALEKIQSEQSIGSYHLVDSYDRAIKLTGRIINCWLPEVDLGETKRPVRLADGKHRLVQINTDAAVIEGDHEYHFPIADDKGRYQVTISSGPSSESEKQDGREFATGLLQNQQELQFLSPQQRTAILALGVRMMKLGPLGDQMADIISPQNQNAQQAQQLSQMQQQGAAMQQQLAELNGLVQKLMLERQGKVIEMQGKAEQVKMQEDTKLAVAQINASKDTNESIADREIQVYEMLHDSAHEVAMQATDQAHQQGMAAQAQAAASQPVSQSASQTQPGAGGTATPQISQ
jgi:hypothetical protein